MKEELTKKMHSEFTISKEEDVSNRVGSAIQAANILRVNKKKEFEEILINYTVSIEDYQKYKKEWADAGVSIELT